MSITATESPQIIHALPGRIRVHLSRWSGLGASALETHICQIQGVRQVQATTATGNVLISFDPAKTSEATLLQDLQKQDLVTIQTQPRTSLPPAAASKHGHTVRARIAVRGLDRD